MIYSNMFGIGFVGHFEHAPRDTVMAHYDKILKLE